MNARARSFIAANEVSPVVYCSVDGGRVTYRLENGKLFHLNTTEARQAPNPRWAFLEREMNATALAAVDREERDLYRRMRAEADL
jgi:hypothetical protein